MTEDDQAAAGAEDEATQRAEAVAGVEDEATERAAAQRRYLATLSAHLDVTVLASEEMWR